MNRSRRMKYMSWLEFSAYMEHCDTFIVPAGAVEVYGPHMPLGSDTLVAEKVSELLAQEVNALIAPMVEFGESAVLSPFNGTVTASPAAYQAIMDDLIRSLIGWGGKNFLFLNMHAGNTPLLSNIARKYQTECGVRCAQVDWWRFVQSHSGDLLEYSGWKAHGHASECGTSLMLYLYPELVDSARIESGTPGDPDHGKYADFITYHNFRDTAPKGVLGEAAAASPEKGKQIVERCIGRIVEFMRHEFNC